MTSPTAAAAPPVPSVALGPLNGQLCCLRDEGERCTRPAGNASFSKRIQKSISQKKVKIDLDKTVSAADCVVSMARVPIVCRAQPRAGDVVVYGVWDYFPGADLRPGLGRNNNKLVIRSAWQDSHTTCIHTTYTHTHESTYTLTVYTRVCTHMRVHTHYIYTHYLYSTYTGVHTLHVTWVHTHRSI